jgi:hypothetical protein
MPACENVTSNGVLGIVSFAVGGAVLFFLWSMVLGSVISTLPAPAVTPFTLVFSFLGFLLVGLGLWLIVQDRPGTKHNLT